MFVMMLAGWVNEQQRAVHAYLKEENRVLRELHGKKRLRFNDDQRRRLKLTVPAGGRCPHVVKAARRRPRHAHSAPMENERPFVASTAARSEWLGMSLARSHLEIETRSPRSRVRPSRPFSLRIS